MKIILSLVVFLHLLTECSGYVSCSYTSYSHVTRRTTVSYYRCSSSQYCCGTRNCCTLVYARWYLWTIIVTFFFIAFILWWYYRYRYRPNRQAVVMAAPVHVAPPTTVTAFNAYPAQPVAIVPGGGGTVPYTAYPPPTYQYPPPPAYSTVVTGNTTVRTVTQ